MSEVRELPHELLLRKYGLKVSQLSTHTQQLKRDLDKTITFIVNKSKNGTIGNPNAEPGELTVSLRKELTGIQYGTVEDRHNWMYKLSN